MKDVPKRISRILEDRAHVQAMIAKRAGLTPEQFNAVLKLRRRLDANEFLAVCAALDMTLGQVAEYGEGVRFMAPRMRTAAGALDITKAEDPETAVTLRYIRRLISTGIVPYVPVGRKKAGQCRFAFELSRKQRHSPVRVKRTKGVDDWTMAERRMFSKAIVNSARFLRMPQTSRLLYYDLGMAADDDGIVEAFAVIRTTGAAEDDLRVLDSKGFVTVLNEDLVSFITDWTENNYIRQDRYKPSIYAKLLVKLADGDKATTHGQPTDNQMTTK